MSLTIDQLKVAARKIRAGDRVGTTAAALGVSTRQLSEALAKAGLRYPDNQETYPSPAEGALLPHIKLDSRDPLGSIRRTELARTAK